MSRVGILTFHRAANYGAVLQAYALKTAIDNLGHEAHVVDYRCARIEGSDERPGEAMPKRLVRQLRRQAREFMPGTRLQQCRKFSREQFGLTRAVDIHTVASLGTEFDAFITGSDQVWNTKLTGDDLTYFLDFAPRNTRRVSYAASFGVDHADQDESGRVIAGYINQFDSVSVRERSGVDVCASLGVKKEVTWVLDPTLLVEQDVWRKLALSEHLKRSGKKYILIYILRDAPNLMKAARAYADKHDCEIVCVSKKPGKDKDVKYITQPSVPSLLGLFRDAAYVLTNSYHGMCMSIQFERQFAYELYRGTGRHVRLVELADLLGLADRELSDGANLPEHPIDLAHVRARIEIAREKSQDFLNDALA